PSVSVFCKSLPLALELGLESIASMIGITSIGLVLAVWPLLMPLWMVWFGVVCRLTAVAVTRNLGKPRRLEPKVENKWAVSASVVTNEPRLFQPGQGLLAKASSKPNITTAQLERKICRAGLGP